MTMTKILMAGLLATLFSAATFAASDLVVKVEGINKAEGRIRVALYSQAKGFKKEKKAVTVQEVFAATEPVTVIIRDLPAGTYALHVVHDRDGDGRLDRLMGLWPQEGYGLSVITDPATEESFVNSRFSHDGVNPQEVVVQVRYCGGSARKTSGKPLTCWMSLSD